MSLTHNSCPRARHIATVSIMIDEALGTYIIFLVTRPVMAGTEHEQLTKSLRPKPPFYVLRTRILFSKYCTVIRGRISRVWEATCSRVCYFYGVGEC